MFASAREKHYLRPLFLNRNLHSGKKEAEKERPNIKNTHSLFFFAAIYPLKISYQCKEDRDAKLILHHGLHTACFDLTRARPVKLSFSVSLKMFNYTFNLCLNIRKRREIPTLNISVFIYYKGIQLQKRFGSSLPRLSCIYKTR